MSLSNSITSPLNLTAKPFPSIVSVWLQPHQNRLLIRERVEDRRNPCSGISCPNKNTRDGSKRVGITVACIHPPPQTNFITIIISIKHTLGSSPFLLVTKNTNVAYVRLPTYLLFIQTEQNWDSLLVCYVEMLQEIIWCFPGIVAQTNFIVDSFLKSHHIFHNF